MEVGLPFLGVGPVSRNVLDAALTAAYRWNTKIMLIPSRSQVDAPEYGRGYTGWTTEQFAEYVRARDPRRLALLCRDHGGPWQHPDEGLLPDEKAVMASCAASFDHDIAAGFDILHLDTSVEPTGEAPFPAALGRLTELYAHCSATAEATGRPLRFEIGFEVQGTDVNDPGLFEAQLDEVCDEITGRGLPLPSFAVAQTGTKVQELSNRGAFPRPATREHVTRQITAVARICRARNLKLKAHNCDYLTPSDVAALTAAGVDAVNVAPEFGTYETRILLRLLNEIQLPKLADRFLSLSFESGKWSKWMAPDTMATDYEKAVIAGHYVFGTPEFADIRAELEEQLARRSAVPLNEVLQSEIALLIERYLLAGTSLWRPAPQSHLVAR
ncbi:class II D-tagatose-bisphosphate aldolase non-catalytic subunit [Streptomyces sp. NPDC059627]